MAGDDPFSIVTENKERDEVNRRIAEAEKRKRIEVEYQKWKVSNSGTMEEFIAWSAEENKKRLEDEKRKRDEIIRIRKEQNRIQAINDAKKRKEEAKRKADEKRRKLIDMR
ncbi:hypothetical protein [Methanimicrococcus blatticola]|nr:hypothetical protein [Methanimicrococcus blatticola]MBZ3936421.1 hypothetical protein [Methanimicrococcus blatticola]MCC2509499.1 hypothetical protein [Methanimicrococcus blatticola]